MSEVLSQSEAASSCLDTGVLEALAAGGVPHARESSHLSSCEACRAALEELRSDAALLSRLRSALGMTDSGPLAIPENLIPGYRLVDEIARGSQGIVYKAVQERTKRTVAVKMLLGGMLASEKQRSRFEREIEIAASLNHPGIVTIYDNTPAPGGRVAYAMEYVEGSVPLNAWCPPSEGGPRAEVRTKLALFAEICDAVHYAHQRGVMHRDLKPANILIDSAGRPHVLDFGIAKTTGSDVSRLTLTLEFAGTLAYASPEQVTERPDGVDVRTDVYSLGVILFEMLSGRLPHPLEGRSIAEAAQTIAQRDAVRLGSIDRTWRGDLDTIVAKALERDVGRRYQSAGALAADIRRHLTGRTIEARRDSTWYVLRKMTARHKLFFGTTLAGMLGLLVFGAAMATLAASRDRERRGLAAEFAASNIELGRRLALSGAIPDGEERIWPELIKAGCMAIDRGDVLFTARPEILHPLWALYELHTHQSCLLTVPIAGDCPTCLSFVTNDTRITSVSSDRSAAACVAETWDLASGDRLARIQLDARGLAKQWSIAAEHDLGAGIGVGRIVLVRLSTGDVIAEAELDGSAGGKATINHAGDRLAVIDDHRRLQLWELPALRALRTLATDVAPHVAPVFNEDDSTLTAIDENLTVRTWGLDGGVHPGGISVAFVGASPMEGARDQKLMLSLDLRSRAPVLAVARGGDLLLWTGAEWSNAMRVSPQGTIYSLAMGSDGSRAVTLDTMLRRTCVWNTASGEILATFTPGAGTQAGECALSSNSTMVASASQNRVLKVWEIEPRAWVRDRVDCGLTAHAVRFLDDSRRLIECGGDGAVRMISGIGDSIQQVDLSLRESIAKCVDVSPDRNATVASVAEDGTLRLTDVAKRATIWSSRVTFSRQAFERQGDLSFVRFTRDGTQLVVAGNVGDIAIFEAASGQEIGLLAGGHSARVSSLAFTPDGETIASVSNDRTCVLWDFTSRRPRCTLEKHTSPVRAVCFAPDGARLVTAGDDGLICIWDAATGELKLPPLNCGTPIYSVAMHPQGRVIASGQTDGSVKFWDLDNGRELASFNYHSAAVFCLDFSPDGKYLASGSADRSLRIWDLHYYTRHLRNNLAYWVERQRAK